MASPVVSIVDHDLILMRVSEEYIGNHMRTVAIDDLVEKIGRVRQRISAIPTAHCRQSVE